MHHLEDRCDAAIFGTHGARQRTIELDLGGRVRAVAELVLQPIDADRIPLTVRVDARHEEAAEAALRLRQHQVRIALRRGEEPFVAGDAPRAAGVGFRARDVGADVGSALALGHAHADQRRALLRDGQRARIVASREDSRQPGVDCISGCVHARSTGTLAYVIVSGHCVPFSTCACR